MIKQKSRKEVLGTGILLLDRSKKVLLQHRDRHIRRYPDYWAFFGGHIEKGKAPGKTAKREIREELGINPKNLKLVGIYKSTSRNEKLFVFTALRSHSIKVLRSKQEEGQDLGIFSFAEAKKLKMPQFERSILRALLNKGILA